MRTPGKRGNVTGWSPGAARRNTAFLRSVDEHTLSGHGVAVTLTLRKCPEDHAEWARIQKAFIDRQFRAGCVRLHWVMEFQSRGVPHLHIAAWYQDEDIARAKPIADWLDITSHLGSRSGGQHVRDIEGAVGWFQYLAKHCGRGRQHYQRQQSAMPKAWEKSPRVWGKRGEWTIVEPTLGYLTQNEFYRMRRLVRSQRIARARASVPGPGWSWLYGVLNKPLARDMPISLQKQGNQRTPLKVRLRHLKQARAMLRCEDQNLSSVRGVSEWIPEPQQLELFRALREPSCKKRSHRQSRSALQSTSLQTV